MTVDAPIRTIKPIETEYAGCRFRSRLEARWAVFFDTLGVRWEYEPQGFETAGGRYLPDFYLPDAEFWVEVKGTMSHADLVKTFLATPDLRPFADGQVQPQLLILGDVPRPGAAWLHFRLDVFHEHIFLQQVYIQANRWFAYPYGPPGVISSQWLTERTAAETENTRRMLVGTIADDRLLTHVQVDDAYRAARSARFEYGETPEPPRREETTAERTQARIRRAAARRKRS
jgi:hypothetical protein